MSQLPFTPLSNLSNHSTAAALQAILKQEQIHWFDGLKAAELLILELQNALAGFVEKQRQCDRDSRELTRQRDKLITSIIGDYFSYNQQLTLRSISAEDQANLMSSILAQINLVSPTIADQVEGCGDRIEALDREMSQVQSIQVRDAQSVLAVAQQQRDRILETHPEALGLDYAELQHQFAPIALRERQAHYLAARIWAIHSGLPETVGVALFDVPVADRAYLIQREQEVRSQSQKIRRNPSPRLS